MRILIISNLTSYTLGFRYEIIQAIIEAGHTVSIACHNDDDEKQKALESLGCAMIEVPFNGKGKNPKEELHLLLEYRRIIGAVKPDMMLSFTIKMNLYGGLAAKSCKVPYVPMITGLGEVEKPGKLQKLLIFLHKRVMPYAKAVVFQNQANIDFFNDHGIGFRKAILVPGSGINLSRFQYCEYPSEKEGLRFAFIGRLTPAKGIVEFIKAAAIEKERGSDSIFYVAGPCDASLEELVRESNDNGTVKYLGRLSDVSSLMKMIHCLVLPTYHPEGLSNVLLEACATGRPCICTDRPGCREVITDGFDGLFCVEKDSCNLVSVIDHFCSMTEDQRREMGRNGRIHVEKNFDRGIVVNNYMGLLK